MMAFVLLLQKIMTKIAAFSDRCDAKKVHKKKYAFIKNSTTFTQSLRNFVKMRYSFKNLILTKFRNDWVKIVNF